MIADDRTGDNANRSGKFSSGGPARLAHLAGVEIEPMKILISAYGCNPDQGSEGWCGWSAVRCLVQDHELHVITAGFNRDDLGRAAREGLIPPGVHCHFG